MKNIATENNENYPSLPSLFFDEKQEKSTSQQKQSILCSLPSELIVNCLSFCDWGDLSKLSVVHSSFRNIISDAATYGGSDAKWHLVQSLLNGTNGLQQNPNLAVRHLTDLSDASFTPAIRQLSKCYLTGDGLNENQRSVEKGLHYLEKAYESNDVDAAHELATIYEYGEYDVPVDIILAAKWFVTAARNGHIEAMAEYAMCCELGCGVPQSDEEALEWYTRAANSGHVVSNFSVGEMFEEAKGVPQSDEEACLWYYKAAVMGDVDSKKALLRLQDIARIVVPGWSEVLNE